MGKKICAALIFSLLLCGCAKFAKGENFSEADSTESLPATLSESAEYQAADETETKQKIPDNRVVLEALIMEASDKPDNYAVRLSMHGDLDNDGRNELLAVYGSEENNVHDPTSSVITSYGELWFADDDGAVLLYTEDNWTVAKPTIDLGDIIILNAERYPDKLSFCFKMVEGRPERMDTFQLRDITYTGNRDFTGYALAYDAGNDKASIKPYWFYLPEGSDRLWEYSGREITLEELSEYEGSQRVLDLISLEYGSEITNILYRDNGIININYKADALGSQFKTLRVLEDGSVEDITPYDNKGWYIPYASGNFRYGDIMYDY